MSNKDDGGMYFPCKRREAVGYDPALVGPGMGGTCETVEVEYPGISRRDHLAESAMRGILSSEGSNQIWTVSGVSERAYLMADAMIAQGKK